MCNMLRSAIICIFCGNHVEKMQEKSEDTKDQMPSTEEGQTMHWLKEKEQTAIY